MLTNMYGLEFGTDHTGKFIIPTSEQVRAAVGSRVVTMTGGLNLNETLLDITIMSINLSMQAAWLAAQVATCAKTSHAPEDAAGRRED